MEAKRTLKTLLMDLHGLVTQLKKPKKLRRMVSSISQSSSVSTSSTSSSRSRSSKCNSNLQSLLDEPIVNLPSLLPPPCSSSTPILLRARSVRQSPLSLPITSSPHWEGDLSGVKIYDEGVVEDEVGYVGQDFPETYFVEEEGAYEIIEVQDLPPHLRGTIV